MIYKEKFLLMGNSIKTFSEFKSENNLNVNEGIFDYVGNLISSAGFLTQLPCSVQHMT